MPKVLNEFEFKARSGFGEKIYDWESLLDGQIYQMVKGEDYDCKTLTVQAMARNQAAKRGLGIRVSAKVEDGHEQVTFQAYEMTEEEKETRKAASAARKAAKGVDPTEPNGDDSEGIAGDENGEHTHEEVTPEPEPVPEPPKPELAPKPKQGKKK